MGEEDDAQLTSRQPHMTILPALTLGLMLGVRHATDADHVAAIGTIVVDNAGARRAAMLGASWGIGHSLSVLLVGGALILWRLPMPPRLALALEFLVAIMLVGLGVRSLITKRRAAVSATRPLLIGIMHGLAGSAVLALLVIGTTSTALGAAAYLVCFCLGTIVGMALVTGLLSLPAHLGSRYAISAERAIRVAAGLVSVAIGLALAHRVGVTDGLFAATPTLQQ
jgi:high-affinity nickel-transport protein